MTLEVAGLTRSVSGTVIVEGVGLTVPAGALVGLVGPNGSGKTTLLRSVAVLDAPDCGTVSLDGADLLSMRRRELATRRALMEQQAGTDLDLTVLDVVLLGRTPFRRPLEGTTSDDLSRAMAALEQVDLARFAERRWTTLSGGERQRAHLARALVQQPDLLLLDEPTNHLDIGHQLQLLTLVRRAGLTTLAALHDLNLTAMFCDAVVVLHGGRVRAAGPVTEVLTANLLAEVFGVIADVERHPATGRLHVVLHPPPEVDGLGVSR